MDIKKNNNKTELRVPTLDHCKLHFPHKFTTFCLTCSSELCENCILEHDRNHRLDKNLKKCRIEYYSKRIEEYPKEAENYFRIARVLKEETVDLLLNGEIKPWTKVDLYRKTIELDPKHALSHNNLGGSLRSSKIILPDGIEYNRQDLYVKAIELDPNYATPLNNLALTLSSADDLFQFPNSEIKMNKRDLFLKAIDLNPLFPDSFANLAIILLSNEEIQLLNGSTMNPKSLLIQAIKLSPSESDYYNNLGSMYNFNHVGVDVNGDIFSVKELYIKAISLNPINPYPYYNLGLSLIDKYDEVLTIPTGEKLNAQQFLLKALEYKFDNYSVLLQLCKVFPYFPRYQGPFKKNKLKLNDRKPIENEMNHYYKSRSIFRDKPLTVNRLLNVHIESGNYRSNIINIRLIQHQNDDYCFKSLVILKSYERFLMNENNCHMILQKIEESDPGNCFLEFLPVLQQVLKSYGNNKIKNSDNITNSDINNNIIEYDYDTPLYILAVKSLFKSTKKESVKLYTFGCLLEIIYHFDRENGTLSDFSLDLKELGVLDHSNKDSITKIKGDILKACQVCNKYFEYTILMEEMVYFKMSNNKTINELVKFLSTNVLYQKYGTVLKELGDLVQQQPLEEPIQFFDLKLNSTKELYLESINIDPYASESYYALGRLLKSNDEKVEIKVNPNEIRVYNKFELFKLSIQLGIRDSSVFYHLAMLIGPTSNTKVNLPILDEESDNHYYGYFDLLCQAIYHDPLPFNESIYRYYLTLIRYLKTTAQ